MNLYIASSWRNELQPTVVDLLRMDGHEVYDFRSPSAGNHGFHWSEIDGGWRDWTPKRFREALTDPIATAGFRSDMRALELCEVCVLLLPCGKSSHLEAGWAKGAGKIVIALIVDGEPELMYGMFDRICLTVEEVVDVLGALS